MAKAIIEVFSPLFIFFMAMGCSFGVIAEFIDYAKKPLGSSQKSVAVASFMCSVLWTIFYLITHIQVLN